MNPVAACLEGLAAQEAGAIESAIEHFQQALLVAPSMLDVRLLLAFALGADGQRQRAQQVLASTPGVARLSEKELRRLADSACQLDANAVAIQTLRQLLRIAPGEPDLHANLAGVLLQCSNDEEAGHVLHRASLQWPAHVPLLLNRARHLVSTGAFHEALGCYDRAVALAPANHHARWKRGLVRLMMGEHAGGWRDQEARRHLDVHTVSVPKGIPAWDGRKVRNRTLLLWGEQGLGDQIQGVRFASLLSNLGATVIVRCAASLKRLFETVPGVSHVVAEGDVLPHCDAHVPMLSVPALLHLHDDASYASLPYVRAPVHINASSQRLNSRMSESRSIDSPVGLVWAGSPGHVNDARRSLNFEHLAALLNGSSTQWLSLQVGERAGEVEQLAPELMASVAHLDSQPRDFADTAVALNSVRRLVTVDTSVAHLAGAMGVPTLLLVPFVPDWRWQLAREDSPWYASIRLLRQPSTGDWTSVIERVHREIAAGGTARSAAA